MDNKYDIEYLYSPDEILDTTVLHAPNVVAEHNSRLRLKHQLRADYENALKKEVKVKAWALKQPPSEQERYEKSLAIEVAKKADESKRKTREDFWKNKHMEYLASTPEVAEISANNTFEFIRELELWISKGYKTIAETVVLSFPQFSAQLKRVQSHA